MCGIAALIGWQAAVSPRDIGAMTRLVRHRGPDDEGYALMDGEGRVSYRGGQDTPRSCQEADLPYRPQGALEQAADRPWRVALGHRRLSIVDLSPAGHQPMCGAGGQDLIVFNGEIYNHLELRRELEGLGHVFRSHSDTEVILAAYRQWGGDCLARFNGMFALVIVDARTGRLFLARDRFGVKPLYYWFSPGGFLALASEIKQFTVLPGWAAALNGPRAYDFLNWALADHTPQTLFAGVFQVPAGHAAECAIADLGRGLHLYAWYRLQPPQVTLSLEDAARRLHALLEDAVRLRLRADVPVGIGLSGGLDSSTIACLVGGLLRAAPGAPILSGFSACSQDPRFDERPYIEEVARATGIRTHHTFPDEGGLFAELDRLLWHQDEPFASTSIYAEWRVFDRVAGTEVKVTLDGHGADELLAGYHGYFGAWLGELLRRGRIGDFARELAAYRRGHGASLAGALGRLLLAALPARPLDPLRRARGLDGMGQPWLDAGRLGVAREHDPYRTLGERRPDVNGMSRAQLLHTSLPVQLHWSDRDSMAHAIEARTPFLDYRVVELVAGCPAHFKIGAGSTKRMLRLGMQGILPERIRGRQDKMGFVTPEELWARGPGAERFRSEVQRAVGASRGILTGATLEVARRMLQGRQPYRSVLWRWVCFGRWLERFGVGL